MTGTVLPEMDEIAASTDAEALNRWHCEAYDMCDQVSSRIESARLAGTGTENWLFRAASARSVAKMTMKRIERRLLELGHEPPLTRDGNERNIIRELRAQVRALQSELRKVSEAEA